MFNNSNLTWFHSPFRKSTQNNNVNKNVLLKNLCLFSIWLNKLCVYTPTSSLPQHKIKLATIWKNWPQYGKTGPNMGKLAPIWKNWPQYGFYQIEPVSVEYLSTGCSIE